MSHKEFWPPAIIARFAENYLFSGSEECTFDTTKENQMILIPGMGAPVSQLFRLVDSLRADADFQSYGITAVQLGLSIGAFEETLLNLESLLESKLFPRTESSGIVLYGHSHGGRFASQIATDLQRKYPAVELKVITGGTPIVTRPTSLKNWLVSLSFREWPEISQPQMQYYSLYSQSDEIVDVSHARTGSKATLVEVDNFSHNDFINPDKIVPTLKKLVLGNRF